VGRLAVTQALDRASKVIGVAAEAELLAPSAHVRAYLDRCRARPAWHRALDGYCAHVEAA
jgi:hypothetical protein